VLWVLQGIYRDIILFDAQCLWDKIMTLCIYMNFVVDVRRPVFT
jgi:hypothetical protein